MTTLTTNNRGSYPTVIGDYIADYWISEIQEKTELTIEEILDAVYYIQKFGHGDYLTGTNSYRVPLARIAEDFGIKLTDGSKIQSSPTSAKAKT